MKQNVKTYIPNILADDFNNTQKGGRFRGDSRTRPKVDVDRAFSNQKAFSDEITNESVLSSESGKTHNSDGLCQRIRRMSRVVYVFEGLIYRETSIGLFSRKLYT